MIRLIVNRHHIVYENKDHKQLDEIVPIYKGEHYIITQLQRRTRNISNGFIKALKCWIALNEDKGVNVE